MTAEEQDEDPRNINILEIEGHCKFEGPQIENPDITMSLKKRQVNIGIEASQNLQRLETTWMMQR